MALPEQFDAIILGAGQGGCLLAGDLGRAGQRTALIQVAEANTACLDLGCVPNQTLIASARVAYLARRAGDFGVQAGPVSVDLAVVRQRQHDVAAHCIQRIEGLPNTELIWGQARFTNRRTVAVTLPTGETRLLAGERIFINTGARPFIPPLDGLADVPYLDSTSILALDAVPAHLLILGGGYAGLEFGQLFRRFGSAVTIVEHGAQIAGDEDPDIAAALMDILRGEEIELQLNAQAWRVDQDATGTIALTISKADGAHVLRGSHLLIAAGRTPNTADLDLSRAEVETDAQGYIQVNAGLETSAFHVYALGDVKGGPTATPSAHDDYRLLRDYLLSDSPPTPDNRPAPCVLNTDPPLGRVGLTEREAQARGIPYTLVTLPSDALPSSQQMPEPRGLMKALIDPASGQILGAAVLGPHGGELMAIFQVAMQGHLPYTALRETVFAHPSLAEGINALFGSLEQRFDCAMVSGRQPGNRCQRCSMAAHRATNCAPAGVCQLCSMAAWHSKPRPRRSW